MRALAPLVLLPTLLEREKLKVRPIWGTGSRAGTIPGRQAAAWLAAAVERRQNPPLTSYMHNPGSGVTLQT
jgi:hypothetical protein